MKRLKERLNKKGFTLAELLIVVAIIAVLVAVSVPVFNGKLEKSREAADVANMRAAKAAVSADYLDGDITPDDNPVYYDAENGVIVKEKTNVNGYGQGTAVDAHTQYLDYVPGESTKDQIIEITIEAKTTGSDTSSVTDVDNVTFGLDWVDKD